MNEKGTVYFFTGLAGAGKTTIGGLFYRHLKEKKPNVFLVDGDRFRNIMAENAGYTDADRLSGARRGFQLFQMMAEQGIDVVVCSIAMYSEIRNWNRKNIENYKEVYIKVDRETLLQRDQKGLYSSGSKNMIGVDLPFDEPKFPDIVIKNDGKESPEVIVERLMREFSLA